MHEYKPVTKQVLGVDYTICETCGRESIFGHLLPKTKVKTPC